MFFTRHSPTTRMEPKMEEVESEERERLLRRHAHEMNYDTSTTSTNRQTTEPKSESREAWSPRRRHLVQRQIIQRLPFLKWIPEYRWSSFPGDLMGALTVASLYVPLSVSFALLGHAHPISGLYSFVISPLIYALLGSCPLMVVGPEAPGSLLVGTHVMLANGGAEGEENSLINAQIAGTVTACTGAVLFVAGLGRLGFVDCVLSRPFMRGFIGAVGLNVLIEQAVTGLGLVGLVKKDPVVAGGSPARKLLFIVTHLDQAHLLTALVSVSSFVIIMIIRYFRNSLELRYRAIAYVPDRFVVVASSAILAWMFDWHEQGLEVLGHIRTPDTMAIPFHWPFQAQQMKHVTSLLSTACLIALLGLFESSLTAKSMRKNKEARKANNITLNTDQELVALGVANIVGGCCMALPAFGGYGRSKLNLSTGGRTPMSNVLLSVITTASIMFLLPAFYYVPKGVLAAMIAVVGYSMIEECPHEIEFFTRIRAWPELFLMAIVFGATVFYSISLGMALGIGWSVLALVSHGSLRGVRIHDPSSDAWEVEELVQLKTVCPDRTLLITISGPLTFANTSALKDRLDALDQESTLRSTRHSHAHSHSHSHSHSSHPTHHPHHKAPSVTAALVFDMRACTNIDGCAIQVLTELAEHHHYSEDTDDPATGMTRIVFWGPVHPQCKSNVLHKLTLSGALELCGGADSSFVSSSGVEDLIAVLEDGSKGEAATADSVIASFDV